MTGSCAVPGPRAAAVTLPAAKEADLDFVTPYLAVGGELATADPPRFTAQLAEICALGITHIVDVRAEGSDHGRVAELAPGLRYLWNGMQDAGQRVPGSWFEHAVSWVEKEWEQHSEAVVLTHCQAGRNRGPSLGFALLLARGVPPVQAIAAIRAARPKADVYYAADALDWHLGRTCADSATRARRHAELDAWRWEHMPEVMSLIAAIDDLRAHPEQYDDF